MTVTAEMRTRLRKLHLRIDASVHPYCSDCKSTWPCEKIRLLDALEAAEKEIQRFQVQMAFEVAGCDLLSDEAEWITSEFHSTVKHFKWREAQLRAGQKIAGEALEGAGREAP